MQPISGFKRWNQMPKQKKKDEGDDFDEEEDWEEEEDWDTEEDLEDDDEE